MMSGQDLQQRLDLCNFTGHVKRDGAYGAGGGLRYNAPPRLVKREVR